MPDGRVVLAAGPDRAAATRKVVSGIGMPDLKGKKVLLKPNFNTADPAPGSTHVDTLRTMVELIKEQEPKRVAIGDRSGPAKTTKVFQDKGVFELGEKTGVECIVFDTMPKERWTRITPPGSHWRNGFLFARPVLEADAVIGLCCLKTHQYGGHFTMSLKLATGMLHGRNMTELHTSITNQRRMIAEMNTAYTPALLIMDGVEAFYEGGPMTGKRWNANLTFASKDRIALDAVGVAALKMHGTTKKIENRGVFEQDQIKRAVELGLGVSGPDEIDIIPLDDEAAEVADKLQQILLK
ncbi:MAG: hypothetical protein QG582_888 [Candidatus Thermoplasmatota archaeon]|nr:hypothetical protein [Candidatus Thermoplasmatota archaeon]